MKILKIMIVSFVIMMLFPQMAVYANVEHQTVMAANSQNIPEGMELIAQDDSLQLYINRETTEIAVKHKESGHTWLSNPVNRAGDPVAKGLNMSRLGSQISVTYFNTRGMSSTLDNFSDSIRYGQFSIEKTDNGVIVVYEIGKKEKILLTPQLISEERFNTLILDKIEDESVARKVLMRYQLIKLEGVDESQRRKMLEDYPMLEFHNIYKLRPLSLFQKEELSEVIEKTGYSLDDLNHDNIENNVEPISKPIVITIPLEYSIDRGTLLVSIPVDRINYPDSIFINQIQVLEFFGAAGTEKEGYMFVPDGSGSLIYLNNGKQVYRSYETRIYGPDNAIPQQEKTQIIYHSHLPVFGLKENDKAFFAIIECGDAHASIKADVSGRFNSYNSVHAMFSILSKYDLTLDGTDTRSVPVFQKEHFMGNIKIRYGFLTGKNSSYSGMAQYYQRYLVEKGMLKPNIIDRRLPFYLELTGAIDVRKSIFGIPFNVTVPLTTYKQAKDILQKLMSENISNINLRYIGWFNGGVNHSYPSSIRLPGKLGGRRNFNLLTDFINKSSVNLFPRVEFQYVNDTKWNDGFNRRIHAVRFISRETAIVYDYCAATFQQIKDKSYRYILRSDRVPRLIKRFLSKFARFNVSGLDVGTLVSDINSDFNEKRFIDRQSSLGFTLEGLSSINDKQIKIMGDKVNAYVLQHVNHILNAPQDSNRFNITDESIPFYQMVLSGYVSYAGQPLNLSVDYRRNVLKTIETGGGIYFSLIYNDDYIVKGTNYDYLYSSNYANWFDRAVTLYHEVNGILGDSYGSRITNHEKIAEGVYRTTFETGKKVVVNYNRYAITADGMTVAAEGYWVSSNK